MTFLRHNMDLRLEEPESWQRSSALCCGGGGGSIHCSSECLWLFSVFGQTMSEIWLCIGCRNVVFQCSGNFFSVGGLSVAFPAESVLFFHLHLVFINSKCVCLTSPCSVVFNPSPPNLPSFFFPTVCPACSWLAESGDFKTPKDVLQDTQLKDKNKSSEQ